MLGIIKHRRLCSFNVFQRINSELDSINCRNMSAEVELKVDTDGPDKKRLKVDEDENTVAKVTEVEKQRVKKRNYALMLCYLGADYYGMQKNTGMKTIEGDLLNALLKCNFITMENLENLRTFNFQRAARTDKGVSAVRQVVSLKLPEHASKKSINEFLPNVIRVFDIKRVTKAFNSKTQCDSRTYRYIIPTFAFVPEGKVLVQELSDSDVEKRMEELSVIDGKPYTDFRLSSEAKEKINSFLELFKGTHNFHNFTSKVKPLDPRAKRYILKFHLANTFVSNDIEFAVLEVQGQSFMLHQIRKMVAVLVAYARDYIKEGSLEEAFKGLKMDIPIAPSLGLSLYFVHYNYYNQRYGTDGIHEPLDWKNCEEEVETFQNEYIIKHIVDTEIAQKTTLDWLAKLPRHSFAVIDEETVAL